MSDSLSGVEPPLVEEKKQPPKPHPPRRPPPATTSDDNARWYLQRATETIGECIACKERDFKTLSKVDRYGFPATFIYCTRCGMVYLSPHMDAETYAEFYAKGHYRRLVEARTGAIKKETEPQYALLLDQLWGHEFDQHRGGTLLDVGGEEGSFAAVFANRHNLKVTILDPAATSTNGAVIVPESAETWQPMQQYDIGIMMHTIDHLVDPVGVLQKLRQCVKSFLIVDIIDFPLRWRLQNVAAVKIDHPTNFHDFAMRAILKRIGWKPEKIHFIKDTHTCCYFCRPSAPEDVKPGVGNCWHVIQKNLMHYVTFRPD